MITLLASLAEAAAPDHIGETYTVGTDVPDIVATSDGMYVAWIESSSGTFTLLDTGSWEAEDTSLGCTGARGLAVASNDTAWRFWAGCDDGTVKVIDVDEDGDVTLAADAVTVGTGQVYGIETDGATVFAVVADETDGTIVAAFASADGGEPDVTGFPATLSVDEVSDTAIVGSYLVVTSGTDDVTKVDLSAGSVVLSPGTLGSRTYGDAWAYDTSNVYLADTGGGLARFNTGSNDYTSSLTAIADTVTAVGIDADAGYMVLGAGDDALVYPFTTGPASDADTTITGAANITEFALVDGYALGATSDGMVHVLTDRPWVTIGGVEPAAALDGDTVTLTFTSDSTGTYEVYLGGTVAGDDGDLVHDGDVTAGETVTVDLTVGEKGDWIEGDNRLWVFVTSDSVVGHAAGVVNVDNPPTKPTLRDSDVGFGNASISIDFEGIPDADLAYYVIYVTDAPFSADSYATGGPAFTGDDDIDVPLVVNTEPDTAVIRTIYPVTNGTTYYVAVRAFDEGGQESKMSNIQSVVPEATYSASQLRGDDSGYFPGLCGTSPAAGFGALVLAALAVTRRRAAPLLGLGVAAVLSVPAAEAKDTETPRALNVQLRYGPTTIADEYVKQVYTNPNQILWFEYGYASQFFDADFGIGLYQELGYLQSADGVPSDEHDMFTMVPLTLTATGRLDFLHEQPIVPFGRIGVDYWMWKENWYVPDEKTMEYRRDGGKYGWHFGGGLMILLDTFDRQAASKLESSAGIDDTYLVAEYRQTLLVHGDQQLNLSSHEITFGLKFDF